MSTVKGIASISINYQEYENMNMSNTNSVDSIDYLNCKHKPIDRCLNLPNRSASNNVCVYI